MPFTWAVNDKRVIIVKYKPRLILYTGVGTFHTVLMVLKFWDEINEIWCWYNASYGLIHKQMQEKNLKIRKVVLGELDYNP